MWPRFLGHDSDGKKKFGPADIVSLVNEIITDEESSSKIEFLNSHHQLSYKNYDLLSES